MPIEVNGSYGFPIYHAGDVLTHAASGRKVTVTYVEGNFVGLIPVEPEQWAPSYRVGFKISLKEARRYWA